MDFLKVLSVYNVMSPKIRLGNFNGDGGYILNESILHSSNQLISLGSGGDYSFESAWIHHKPNSPIEIYDGTCGCYDFCTQHTNVKYVQKNVGVTADTEHLASILNNKSEVFLKIDIESSEYIIFDDSVNLNNVTGMVIEFHDIRLEKNRQNISGMLKNKFSNFILFHLHANNWGDTFDMYGYNFPDVIEMSFINKNIIKYHELDTTTYPIHGLDVPNRNGHEDIKLDWINKFER
jgi:hypothetical protein